MKTQELISKIKMLGYGYTAELHDERVSVNTSDGKYIGNVRTNIYGVIDTDTYYTTEEPTTGVYTVLGLMLQYALTPLEKRGDMKKYFVKLLPHEQGYLNVQENTGYMRISDVIEADSGYKTKFTKQEYKKLQDKYPDWLPEFDENSSHFIEVREDD